MQPWWCILGRLRGSPYVSAVRCSSEAPAARTNLGHESGTFRLAVGRDYAACDWGRYRALFPHSGAGMLWRDMCRSGAPILVELWGAVPCRARSGPRVYDGQFVEAVEVAGVTGDHGHVVVEGGGGDECVSKGSGVGYVHRRCLAGDLGIDWQESIFEGGHEFDDESAWASPSGQRAVTVLTLVQKRTPSMPCWLASPKALRFQPPKVW